VKFTVNILEERGEDKPRRWSHIFGGRVRTSTFVLIIAFLAVWWVYDTYRPEPPAKPPAPQVVPPGFVPDPNYTWVPRTRVNQQQQQPTPTPTVPSTSMPTETTPPGPTTTTTTPAFTLPCLVPALCPSSTSPTPVAPQLPQPGPGPAPTSPQPAG
jgi:hypothetical protein